MSSVLQKQCLYCGKQFELIVKPGGWNREYCSRSCGAKGSITKRTGAYPWSDPELDLIQKWLGKKPLQQIVEEWNKVAKKRGWPQRSDEAVKLKLQRVATAFGKTRRATDDNWTMYELSRLLDIPVDRVRTWYKLGLKRQEYSYSDSDKKPYIRPHITATARCNLRQFALINPGQFWGIDQRRLSKALGDSKLAKQIHQTVEQPTVGRKITVIRLDTGDVYQSAKDAACQLNLADSGKTLILRLCHRDTPARNGMDFCRLDYPIFWVPLAVRKEFNFLAGKLLYELYLRFKDVAGYQKTSCLIVAGRMAVQITLMSFRRRQKQIEAGEIPDFVENLAEFWQLKFIANIDLFLSMNSSQGWRRLTNSIKYFAWNTFARMLPGTCGKELQRHLQEYAFYYISYSTEYFLKKSYLPKDYKPSSKLENADLFAAIYGSIVARIDLGKKGTILLSQVIAMRYILREIFTQPRQVDLSGTGLDENDLDRGFQYHAQASAVLAPGQGEPSPAQQMLDDLLAYIQGLPGMTDEECERYQMYVALKLEDCSNAEIAKVLEISEREVVGIETALQKYAKKYQQKMFCGNDS